jgi:hypothetical protein
MAGNLLNPDILVRTYIQPEDGILRDHYAEKREKRLGCKYLKERADIIYWMLSLQYRFKGDSGVR